MIFIKKYLFLLIFLFFLTGCSQKKDKINTIIEKNKHSVISIHYPNTNIKKIDKKIEKYIQKTYQTFKNDEKKHLQSELNIDYTYFTQNQIHTICLTTYINHFKNTADEQLNCITYDNKRKKHLYLKDLFEKENWTFFVNQIKYKINRNSITIENLDKQIEELSNKFTNFTFTDHSLTVFLKNGQKNIPISINIEELILKVDIKKQTFQEKIKDTQKVDFIIDPTKPVIALTFDDGPTQYTEEILDVLQKENVTATFFVLGNKVETFQETIKKAVNQGNEIGNHSYNHKWLSRLSTDEIKWQINETQEKIKNITGMYPRYLRPTYGSINNRIRKSTDLNIVLWDIDPKDWKNQSPTKTAQRILDKVSDGKIILLHDNHKRTVEAIKILIPKLKEKGYQLVTLSDLEQIHTLIINF